MSYKKVFVISRSNSLWKINESDYTTENFTPDEKGNIKLETGWILHGADPRQVTKKFKDCFIDQDAALNECKARNESLGYVNTEKKDKQRNFISDIKMWKEQLNQECSVWYNCSIYDKSKSKLLVSNKSFRFIDYINGFLKVGFINEPNSLLNVKAATSIDIYKLDLHCGGYLLSMGDFIIAFIHTLEKTVDGNKFIVKDLCLKDGSYEIIPFER